MGDPTAAVDKPPQRRWGDLGVRAASGVALIVVAIVTARHGGFPFLAVWLVAAVAALHEWQRLVAGPAAILRLVVGALAIVAAALAARANPGGALVILVAAAIALAALAGPGRRLWAAAGVIYAGVLVVAVVSLRFSFPFGARAIVWLFATVWSTDVFAYFGGRLIGGPKLWPRVSPSKTWAGTLTGVTAGAAIGTFAALRDLPGPSALLPVLALSLAAAILSQVGDAFESAVKRHFGVKDSGNLIPGHGGVMDRVDGFIAAAAFAFFISLVHEGGIFYWA